MLTLRDQAGTQLLAVLSTPRTFSKECNSFYFLMKQIDSKFLRLLSAFSSIYDVSRNAFSIPWLKRIDQNANIAPRQTKYLRDPLIWLLNANSKILLKTTSQPLSFPRFYSVFFEIRISSY